MKGVQSCMKILKVVFCLLIMAGIACEAAWLFTGKEKDLFIIIGLALQVIGIVLQVIHFVIESIISSKKKRMVQEE